MGTTISFTPDIKDFISYEEISIAGFKNITGTSPVCGRGKAKWIIYDNPGNPCEIITEAYYVSDAKVRLFSVQHYLSSKKVHFI